MTESPVRAAIAGLGTWGMLMAPKVAGCPKLELVAAFDTNGEALEGFCLKYGCRKAGRFVDVLDDESIEAVLLFTPNDLHCEQTVLAAQHGKHVYVTKPIANQVGEAHQMIDACEKAGVVLFIGHNRRREPGVRAIHGILSANELGRVTMVEANISHGGGLSLKPDSWRWHRDRCPGGPLVQLGIHQIDTLHYLFGPVRGVRAVFGKTGSEAEIDTVTMILLEFESGVLGFVGSNYVCPPQYYINVYGTQGSLFYNQVFGVDEGGFALTKESLGGLKEDLPLISADVDMEAFLEFADCIRNGRRPEVGGQEGLRALAIVRAAIEANEKGKGVEVGV